MTNKHDMSNKYIILDNNISPQFILSMDTCAVPEFKQMLTLLKQIKECDGDVEKIFPIAIEYYKEMCHYNDGLIKMDKKGWDNMYKICSDHIVIASSDVATLEYKYHYPEYVVAYDLDDEIFESLPLDDFISALEVWIRDNELYQQDKENYIDPEDREGFVEYKLNIKSGNSLEEVLGEKREIKTITPKPFKNPKKENLLDKIKSMFRIK